MTVTSGDPRRCSTRRRSRTCTSTGPDRDPPRRPAGVQRRGDDHDHLRVRAHPSAAGGRAGGALRRLDYWTRAVDSLLPEFSTGYTMPDTGFTYRFGGPELSVGDLAVDRIYGRYRRRLVAVA
ncbi:MAG: hypothetical protein R2695_04125 [Acidimicrobiales bacterium]